jgi:hypothetical protein
MTFSYANAATNKKRPEGFDTTAAKTPAWNGNKQVKQEQHQHQRISQSQTQQQQQQQQQNNHIKNPPQNNEKLPTTSTWGSVPKQNPSTSTAVNTTVTVTPVLSRPDNESRSDNIKKEETQSTTAKAAVPKPTNTNNHNDRGNDNNKKDKAIKIEHNNNNNNAEDDSWNVVVTTKKNVPSSTAVASKHSRTSLSSQPQAIPNNKVGQNKNTSQQPVTKNNAINPNKSNSSNNNNNNNNSNSNKNPKPKKSTSNDNTKKIPKKPKPMARSIGDMITEPNKKTGLILGKKKNNNKNDNGKKKASQQLQQQQQRFPNLQMDNTQDFPTLGSTVAASDTVTSITVSATSGQKKGWGSLPKTPPASFHPNQVAPPKAAGSNNLSSSLSSSSSPSRKKKNNSTIFMGAPSRVLKRGEALPKTNMAGTQSNGNSNNNKKKKKKSQNKNDPSNKATFPSSASSFSSPTETGGVPLSASSFFQPKLRSNDGGDSTAAGGDKGNSTIRGLEGEEHELLRLMQERTVYQKKGRQRVAPRKKKFTALKKKVLQERLDKWRELHPEESDESEKKKNNSPTVTTTSTNTDRSKDRSIPTTCYLCIYNYTTPEELDDEDEYEEIVENLKGMSLKIGCIDEVFIPRSKLEYESHGNNAGDNNDDGTGRSEDNKSNNDDNNNYHPAIVKFQKVSDAAAALACWNGLVVGGSILEVVGLDVPTDEDGTTTWSERALAAEFKRRNESQASVDEEMMKPIELILQKVLTDDDYDDEDCMSESLDDLKQIAEKFGEIQSMQANATKNGDVIITYVSNIVEARNIAESLCRVVVCGQPLYASVREQPIEASDGGSSVTILLENILTEDDLEDNDCLQESLNDIKELCLRYGSVSDVIVKGSAVKLTYSEDKSVVEKAVSQLNGTLLGGNTVEASLLIADTESSANDDLDSCIDLHNLLTEDDLEDEECMEESISDVRELASKYGEVVTIDVLKVDDDSFLRIRFGGDTSIAVKAVEGFRGMVVGGQIVNASLSGRDKEQSNDNKIDVSKNSGDKRKPDAETKTNLEKKARTDDKAPLYSGDKLIPERFAEMKRAPKIPNAAGPRDYANTTNDERVRPLLAEMLRELMRLQKRAVEDKNAKARRRMVMGLREVARGIRAHKGMLNNIMKIHRLYL